MLRRTQSSPNINNPTQTPNNPKIQNLTSSKSCQNISMKSQPWLFSASYQLPIIQKIYNDLETPKTCKNNIDDIFGFDFGVHLALHCCEKIALNEMINNKDRILSSVLSVDLFCELNDSFENKDKSFILAKVMTRCEDISKTSNEIKRERKILTNTSKIPIHFNSSTFICNSYKINLATSLEKLQNSSALFFKKNSNTITSAFTTDKMFFSPENASTNNCFDQGFIDSITQSQQTSANILNTFVSHPYISSDFSFINVDDIKKTYAAKQSFNDIHPHNEVLSKLWPWELKAINISSNKEMDTNTYFEITLMREKLYKEIELLGIKHPLIQQYIENELAFNQNGGFRDHQEMSEIIDKIRISDVLDEIKKELRIPLIFCKYHPDRQKIEHIHPDTKVLEEAFKKFLCNRNINI